MVNEEYSQYPSVAEQAQDIQARQQEYEDLQNQVGQMAASQNADFNRWQLDNTPILEIINQTFLGLYWEGPKVGGKWVQRGHPIMTQEGGDAFMTMLYTIACHTITLSDFTQQEINRMALEARVDVINMIHRKHRDFKINKAYFDTIVHTVDRLAYAILKRALNGGERRHLGTVRKSVEQFVQRSDVGEKKGWSFAGLFRR